MESQKIINLLDHKDEDVVFIFQNLKQKSGILLIIIIMEVMAEVMICNLLLSLIQKM